jgi:hypothetical protein
MIAVQDHVINVLNYMQHIHNDPQVMTHPQKIVALIKKAHNIVFLFVRICHLDTKPGRQCS